MTAIEDDLTRALRDHYTRYRDGNPGCACGWMPWEPGAISRVGVPSALHRAHLAAALAPIVAKHVAAGQERAWDEAVGVAFGGIITRQNSDDIRRLNPYRAATYTTTKENDHA